MNTQLLQDLKFGLRLIRRSPGSSFLAILCLASGIGLTTFMFSIAYAVVGRGLPFEDQDKIILLQRLDVSQTDESTGPFHLDDYRQIVEQQESFRNLAGVAGDGVTLGRPGHPHFTPGAYVSPSMFRILPEKPMLGRALTDADARPDADPVVLLGYKAWRDAFGSDPDVVGSDCIVEGQPFTVIGVMPASYDYPFGTEAWMPLIPETLLEQTGWIDTVNIFGRLRDDRSLEAAQAEFEVILERIDEAKGESELVHSKPTLRPLFETFVGRELRIMMWTMFTATFLVLLIACTNVSSLLTARVTARENELAVRSALGANRKRIILQILAETLLYGLIGAGLGLLLAWRALVWLWQFVSNFRFSPPAFMEFSLDPISIIVAGGLMLVAVFVSGFIPAWRSSRLNIGSLLNDSQRTGSSKRLSRMSSASTIIQLAFSLALLVAAGRLILGIIYISSAEYPFEKEGLLIGSLSLDSKSYPEEADQIRFWEELHRNLQSLPGADSVSLGFNMPAVFGMADPVEIPGQDYASEEDFPRVRFDVVAPGYFETIGVDLLEGRDFNYGDQKGNESVAIINTVMAEKFWPGEDALGKSFRTSDRGGLTGEERMHRIIGIVPDLKMDGLFNEADDGAGFYRSQGQGLWGDQKIIVRTSGNPNALIPDVQRKLSEIDPDIAFTDAKSFEEHVHDTFFYFRFFLNLFSVFGGMALLLTATGIYGIIQYGVTQRILEIGIRMSLGATPAGIRWMILRRGMVNTLIGLAIGFVFAVAMVQVLNATFLNSQTEYVSFLVAALLLFTISLVANIMPALRAARMDPMVALRIK